MNKWEKRFPGDLAMQELHQVWEQIQGEIKGMSVKEINEHFANKMKAYAQQNGYRYIALPNGSYRLEKKTKQKKAG